MEAPARRGPSLGAEELIELGQTPGATFQPSVTTFNTTGARQLAISREEAELMVRTVTEIINFAKGFPIEFYAYCPPDRWQKILEIVSTGVASIEKQLASSSTYVMVSGETVFAMMDLEECVTGARDARLQTAKVAMWISAAGAAAQTLLGWKWVAFPAYVTSLAIVLGKPLFARLAKTPADPFRVEVLKGSDLGSLQTERVLVDPELPEQAYHWGVVRPRAGGLEHGITLGKGSQRVRVEGWVGDQVSPMAGWVQVEDVVSASTSPVVLALSGRPRKGSRFGPAPDRTRHREGFWVEYVGTLTNPVQRLAGPFKDARTAADHARLDSGMDRPGGEGAYAVFDASGRVVLES